jgi:hypothetical protein
VNLQNGQPNPEVAKFIETLKTRGREIGRIVGEEVGKEVTDEVAKKSAQELYEWAGKFIGRVAFEIILTIAMEVLGVAAARLAEWVAKLPAIVARLLRRLRQILGQAFESLRELIRGARAAEDAAEAARVARGGLEAAEVAGNLIKEYVDLSEGAASTAERELGRFLDGLAQRGQLGEVKRLRGMPEVEGAASPDYHLFLRNIENAELRNPSIPADLRGDAVIAEGSNIDNIISGAIGSKAGRQADAIFIDIGSRGISGQITDAAVKAWKIEDVAPMSPSLRRLMVIRSSGGARSIVLDLRIR